MDFFPTDPKKLKSQISRYNRSFRMEEEQYGSIRDGAGKRYLLSPMYMLLGDNKAALTSFLWFEEKFPDDIGEPGQYLCWALCLYRACKTREAEKKLMQTAFQNLYMIPRLIHQTIDVLDIWHYSNYAEKEYLEDIPDEYWELWKPNETAWAAELWQRNSTQDIIEEYIDLSHQLLSAPGGSSERQVIISRKREIEHSFDY